MKKLDDLLKRYEGKTQMCQCGSWPLCPHATTDRLYFIVTEFRLVVKALEKAMEALGYVLCSYGDCSRDRRCLNCRHVTESIAEIEALLGEDHESDK